VPVTFDARIYEAAAPDLLTVIREVPPATGTLLLIGHNPAIEDLALLLATAPGTAAGPAPGGAGRPGPVGAAPADLERMRSKFPTAAIAVLVFPGTWAGLAPGRARLTAFVTPRDLDPGQATST
jgi:phosphohistidine phosphatase